MSICAYKVQESEVLKLKQKHEKLEYIISVVIFSMILIGLESLMMIIMGGGKL